MKEIFEKRFFTQFTTTQLYLMAGNFLLVFFLILLFNLGILPIKNLSDFLFFTFLFLFFSLYRPGWAFLFFIGSVALENINLAPASLNIAVRPYQFSGALIILAILIRWISRRLNFELIKLKWYDYLVILTVVGGFVSALGSANRALSFKLSVIFASFAALYLLIRNYIRDMADLKKIIPFFLSSSVVIVLYGIWQNVRFAGGFNSFEVMPGRPNSTFPEADWLGIYLVVLVAVIYALIIYSRNKSANVDSEFKIQNSKFKITSQNLKVIFLYFFLIIIYIATILTVSRSAWLGVLAATLVFLLLILTELKINPKNWRWKEFFWNSFGILISGIMAVVIVYFFQLTSFQLFNRIQSTSSGLQKITVACPGNTDVAIPQTVQDEKEFTRYSCRHINLEEIANEKLKGNVIYEIYRPDPNVSIRKEIYGKSWEQIKKNPLLGIGWGSIGKILGTDERPARIATPARSDAASLGEQSIAGGGASLNASNVFLEVWLGAGFLGLLAFLIVWIYIIVRAVSNYIKAANFNEQVFAIFTISGWFGITASNLFNAGIMLGFLWLFLAVSFIDLSSSNRTTT